MYIIALHPILTDQIRTKYVEFPKDIEKRTAIAAGGHQKVKEAIARIETLVLMAGVELPSRAIREQIANSIHVVTRSRATPTVAGASTRSARSPGSRTARSRLRPIFEFVRTGTGPGGKVLGFHRATGYLPSYLDVFIIQGLVKRGAVPVSKIEALLADPRIVKWLGFTLFVVGTFFSSWLMIADPEGRPRRYCTRATSPTSSAACARCSSGRPAITSSSARC